MAELVTIARPYAEAAFQLARDEHSLAAWSQMLQLAASIVSDERVNTILSAASARAFDKWTRQSRQSTASVRGRLPTWVVRIRSVLYFIALLRWCGRVARKAHRVSTVRSTEIDGMKKHPAAVKTTNWTGISSVVRRLKRSLQSSSPGAGT